MSEEEKYKKAINELADSYELHLKQWAKRCIDTINEYTTNLQQELQQKENIIKEVRDILKFHLSNPSGTKNGWHIDIWSSEDINKLNEFLEILDKEVN